MYLRSWKQQGLPEPRMWLVREREVEDVAWASGLRSRGDGQGIYWDGKDWGRSMLQKERPGVNWICFRHIKFKDFIYLFLKRAEEREKEWERNINVNKKHWSVASCKPPPSGGWTEPATQACVLNWRPFNLLGNTQPTEPQWSELDTLNFNQFWRLITSYVQMLQYMNWKYLKQ